MKNDAKAKLQMYVSPSQSVATLPSVINKSSLRPLTKSVQESHSYLFSYDEYSSAPSPYPKAPFMLTQYQKKSWLSKKVEDNEEELSDHDDNFDEEEQDAPTDSLSPNSLRKRSTPARIGARAVAEFFAKYKGINKITSPANDKRASATYRYLKEVDQLHHVPHPMGMVKWKGQANELNLQ